MFAYDADDFYVVRRTTFWRLGVTDVLTDRFLVRKELFREFLVNDSDTTPVLLFAFRLSEISPAQQFYPERVEITGGDRGIKGVSAWISRFWVGRHRIFHANDSPRVGEIRVGQHCTAGRSNHPRQLPRPVNDSKYQLP